MNYSYGCRYCGNLIELLDGCNAIKCSNCAHNTCAFCLEDFGHVDSHHHFPGYIKVNGVSQNCNERDQFEAFARKTIKPIGNSFPLYSNSDTMEQFKNNLKGLKLIEEIKKIPDLNVSNEIVQMLKRDDKDVRWIKDFIVNDAMKSLSVFNDLPLPPNPIKLPKNKKGATKSGKKVILLMIKPK